MTVESDLWQFYWRSDIPVPEIADAFGLPRVGLHKKVGPALVEGYNCKTCGTMLPLLSRAMLTDFRAGGYGLRWVCETCLKKQQAEAEQLRAARQQERLEGEAKAKLAEQERIQRLLGTMLPVVLRQRPATGKVVT